MLRSTRSTYSHVCMHNGMVLEISAAVRPSWQVEHSLHVYIASNGMFLLYRTTIRAGPTWSAAAKKSVETGACSCCCSMKTGLRRPRGNRGRTACSRFGNSEVRTGAAGSARVCLLQLPTRVEIPYCAHAVAAVYPVLGGIIQQQWYVVLQKNRVWSLEPLLSNTVNETKCRPGGMGWWAFFSAMLK